MQKSIIGPLSVIVIVLLSLIAVTSLYNVYEGQHALVSHLGKLKTDKTGEVVVRAPGLHFKIPFIEKVLKFNTRLRTLAPANPQQLSRIMTANQKEVLVDYFVKWRINDLPLYYKRTSGQSLRTDRLLEQQVSASLRAEFGKRTIKEVVSDERAKIMKALDHKTDIEARKLGIDVLDVRIKRIDLPDEVSNSVFERMRVERERVAREHRAQGQAQAEAIRADADAAVTVMVAQAQADANQLRAKGDAKAANIYSNTYNKNPEFYAFYRSLEAYTQTFNATNNDIMLLTPKGSQFFSYFSNAKGKKS